MFKKEYSKPNLEVLDFGLKEDVTALTVSTNALDWVNGTGSGADSVEWE